MCDRFIQVICKIGGFVLSKARGETVLEHPGIKPLILTHGGALWSARFGFVSIIPEHRGTRDADRQRCAQRRLAASPPRGHLKRLSPSKNIVPPILPMRCAPASHSAQLFPPKPAWPRAGQEKSLRPRRFRPIVRCAPTQELETKRAIRRRTKGATENLFAPRPTTRR